MFRNEEVGKSIVLFTDGSNTVSAFVDDGLTEIIDYAIKENLVIHAVGLGTNDATVGYLPDIFNLTSSINTDALDALSSATGGKVIYPESTQILDTPDTGDFPHTQQQTPFF